MALYRAQKQDGVAWITGASTGIGRALALDLVADGWTVAATARDEDRLAALVQDPQARGRILSFPGDVSEEAAMAACVARIEREAGPVALAVFNAGTYLPTRGERMNLLNIVRTYEVNLLGVLYGLVPTVERMRAHGRGHLVILGSASAYFGWPSAAAYGSSKAALNNFAESVKHDLDRLNIRIQVVNPGFVDTPLIERSKAMMPAVISAEEASARILRAIARGGFETDFPRRFTWPVKLMRLLPASLRFGFVHRATKWKDQPLAKARRPRD